MNDFMNVTKKSIETNNTKTKSAKSAGKTENGTDIIMPGQETDKNLFLKLLVAQMGHQDPMNPQDPTQYITQLAQFNTLEQMQNLNDNTQYMAGLTNGVLVNSAMSTASSMIGKKVEAYAPEEDANEKNKIDANIPKDNSSNEKKRITGVVEGIKIENGIVYMDIRDNKTGELKSVEYGTLIKASENK